jgi:predicted N-acyltransferase
VAEIEILEGIAEVPREAWNALVGDQSPFLEWDWLASLEQAGAVGDETGWGPRPLVARRDGRLVAACPLYVKAHSEGEYVFDWSWADAAQRAGIAYYPKLLVGVPFTPVGGARFLVAESEAREPWIGRMAAALRELCTANELSGVHVNFCREDELEPGRRAGFQLRIGVQYHWLNPGYASFEDYLARFRSKRRNQIRRERRALREQGVAIEVLEGEGIEADLLEPLYRFYASTLDKRIWGRQYLPRRFFELLWERFRHRLCLAIARRNGKILAGTINVRKGDALYGRYWGCDRELPHLHFNVCYYAAIEHCIRAGIRRFEPGAGGDYKQVRGFDARPTWSLHFLAEPRLARAVERFLEAERAEAREALDWLRDHSAYKTDVSGRGAARRAGRSCRGDAGA